MLRVGVRRKIGIRTKRHADLAVGRERNGRETSVANSELIRRALNIDMRICTGYTCQQPFVADEQHRIAYLEGAVSPHLDRGGEVRPTREREADLRICRGSRSASAVRALQKFRRANSIVKGIQSVTAHRVRVVNERIGEVVVKIVRHNSSRTRIGGYLYRSISLERIAECTASRCAWQILGIVFPIEFARVRRFFRRKHQGVLRAAVESIGRCVARGRDDVEHVS